MRIMKVLVSAGILGLIISIVVYERHVGAESEAGIPIKRVAFTPTPQGWPRNIIVHGNQILLSNGETYAGLQRIDWRQAKTPRLAQSFDVGNFGRNAILLGNRVYALANYHGVTMFRLSQDGTMVRSGHWRLPPPANHGDRIVGLMQHGRYYLYLHIAPEGGWKDWPAHPESPHAGLYLLDVTNARQVQVHDLGDKPLFDRIENGYGYVLRGAFIDIYALNRPNEPRLIGSYQASGKISAISVDHEHLWLVVDGHALDIVDISEPSHPRRLAYTEDGGMRQAASIAARGEWAYVVESGQGFGGPDHGVHVFRLQNGQLRHIRHVQWPRTNLQRIVLAGTTAYVTDNFYGVWRLDLTQPDRPVPVSLYMSAGEIQQLLIDPPTALANLEWGGTVAILDVSDPLHIRIRGYYRPGHFDDYAVAIIGHYFYYGKYRERRIIDVQTPETPTEVGKWTLSGMPLMPPLKWQSMMFQWLKMTDGSIRLTAWNMHDPVHPKRVGSLTLPDTLAATLGSSATDGRRLFAVADNEVVAIDVQNPAHMRLLSAYHEQGIGREAAYHWQGSGRRAALAGNALYIIQGSEALDAPRIAVLDVSRPRHMRKVFVTSETPPAFQDDWFDERLLHQGDMLGDMFVRGDFLYVSDYWGGVRIYDCQKPFHPKLRDWEFKPYLSLMPKNWSRPVYARAVASGNLQKALRINARTWAKRNAIGRKIWSRPLVYHPGYDLFGWNIGGFVGHYLLQPKLGGIAVYRVRMNNPDQEFVR